jgi:hypothetical protein
VSDIAEAGVGRHAVCRAEISLANAIVAHNQRWYDQQYERLAAADGLAWEVHCLRADVSRF